MAAFLHDGFSTIVVLSIAGATADDGGSTASVVLIEKEVHPPEMDLGEIDTTTMRSLLMRTKQPKSLVTLGALVMQCQYDPEAYIDLESTFLGVLLTVTVIFPDTTTLAFLGWLDKFTPAPLQEGVFPLAEVRIMPSNQDGDGNEVLPTGDGVNFS